jgi:hypothetical protein
VNTITVTPDTKTRKISDVPPGRLFTYDAMEHRPRVGIRLKGPDQENTYVDLGTGLMHTVFVTNQVYAVLPEQVTLAFRDNDKAPF